MRTQSKWDNFSAELPPLPARLWHRKALMRPMWHHPPWNQGVPFWALPHILWSLVHGIFCGGDLLVQVILPENLCNWSPGICALVIQEETPSHLHIGFPADGLAQLTKNHCIVLAKVFLLVLLLTYSVFPDLPGSILCLCVLYQARVDTSLPEVHPHSYPWSNFPGSEFFQRLFENYMSKDEGYLGVTTPVKNTLPSRSQYDHKPAPYWSCRCVVPSGWLCGQPAPTTLPHRIFQDSPIHVQPDVVMQEVSVDSSQQQVHMFWGEFRQGPVFLQWGAHHTPHTDIFCRYPPQGAAFSFLFLHSLPSLFGLLAFLSRSLWYGYTRHAPPPDSFPPPPSSAFWPLSLPLNLSSPPLPPLPLAPQDGWLGIDAKYWPLCGPPLASSLLFYLQYPTPDPLA